MTKKNHLFLASFVVILLLSILTLHFPDIEKQIHPVNTFLLDTETPLGENTDDDHLLKGKIPFEAILVALCVTAIFFKLNFFFHLVRKNSFLFAVFYQGNYLNRHSLNK